MKIFKSIETRIRELQKKALDLRLGSQPWIDFYMIGWAMDASIELHEAPKNPFKATRAELGGLTPCQAGQDLEKFPMSELEIERQARLLSKPCDEEKRLLKKLWFATVKGRSCSAKELKETRLRLDEYGAWRKQNYCFMYEREATKTEEVGQ